MFKNAYWIVHFSMIPLQSKGYPPVFVCVLESQHPIIQTKHWHLQKMDTYFICYFFKAGCWCKAAIENQQIIYWAVALKQINPKFRFLDCIITC